MLSRTVHMKEIKVDNIIISSVFQVGDSSFIDGFSRALAVQEKKSVYKGGSEDEDFPSYKIFSIPASIPVIYENIPIFKIDAVPKIQVHCLHVISASASSVISIGNIGHARMTSRIHHIRKLTESEEVAYLQQTEGG